MYSKAKFDLNEKNESVIRLTISNDNEDLRDVVARQFVDYLGGDSRYCKIMCDRGQDGVSYWTITPIKPSELLAESKSMARNI